MVVRNGPAGRAAQAWAEALEKLQCQAIFRVVVLYGQPRDIGLSARDHAGVRASKSIGDHQFVQVHRFCRDAVAAVPAVGGEGVHGSGGSGHDVALNNLYHGPAHVACDEVKHFLPQQWRLVGKLNHVACIGEGMDGFVAQLSVGGVRFFKGFIGREWGLFGYALFYRGRNGKASF